MSSSNEREEWNERKEGNKRRGIIIIKKVPYRRKYKYRNTNHENQSPVVRGRPSLHPPPREANQTFQQRRCTPDPLQTLLLCLEEDLGASEGG